jgi:hypothetical protein
LLIGVFHIGFLPHPGAVWQVVAIDLMFREDWSLMTELHQVPGLTDLHIQQPH